MNTIIKTIEELSLNAWPSHQSQLYDGWLLRFSYFYTHRTNCVEQVGLSSLSIEEKIQFCEEEYRRWGTPSIFKITPLLDSSFEQLLTAKGYLTEHTTEVMLLDYSKYTPLLSETTVHLEHSITDKWINGLFSLKSITNAIHREIVPSMYHAIPKNTIAASIVDSNGMIIGIGLGILDRSYIGIYAIHVHPHYRGHHYAHSICTALLNAGKDLGMKGAYLQVVEGNKPARHLYESLGFKEIYKYWFRVKELF